MVHNCVDPEPGLAQQLLEEVVHDQCRVAGLEGVVDRLGYPHGLAEPPAEYEHAWGVALDPFEVREVVRHHIVAGRRSRSGIGPSAMDWCPARNAIRPAARADSPVNFAAKSLLA